MNICYCDWPTVAEPPSIFQASLELHRAVHDLARELIDALGIERLLQRMSK